MQRFALFVQRFKFQVSPIDEGTNVALLLHARTVDGDRRYMHAAFKLQCAAAGFDKIPNGNVKNNTLKYKSLRTSVVLVSTSAILDLFGVGVDEVGKVASDQRGVQDGNDLADGERFVYRGGGLRRRELRRRRQRGRCQRAR
jgi:hypothetical protein